MAKKKVATLPPCLHCNVVFHVPMRWCGQCESHCGLMSWTDNKEVCDACFDGSNDRYNEWRLGHAERVADAVEKANDPKNWGPNDHVVALAKWVSSPEYEKRFDK